MILLLIIADDFTGALDTGVQFAARGIRTQVVVDPNVDIASQDAEVLVVDTETRHLDAGQAYAVVFRLTERARQAGVRHIYKKTDSALRGNIGAELSAALEASGEKHLFFIPAFPQIGRTTKNGVHYIRQVPVADSPFGQDPFEPVLHSRVTELIAAQCSLPAASLPASSGPDSVPKDRRILIFDTETTGDLRQIGRRLADAGRLSVLAGCAGFAAELPDLLGIDPGHVASVPALDPRLLVICGSVNPITIAQMDHAERMGFKRLRLTPQQKLDPDFWETPQAGKLLASVEEMLARHPRCIIETNDLHGNQLTAGYAALRGIDRKTLRTRIAGSLGQLTRGIFFSPSLGTILMTGGDTLLQCMSSLGVARLIPICEMEKGVVLAQFTYGGRSRHIITKSGGFGQESLITDLAERIAHHINKEKTT